MTTKKQTTAQALSRSRQNKAELTQATADRLRKSAKRSETDSSTGAKVYSLKTLQSIRDADRAAFDAKLAKTPRGRASLSASKLKKPLAKRGK